MSHPKPGQNETGLMIQHETVNPEQLDLLVSEYRGEEEPANSFADVIATLLPHKKFIGLMTLVLTVISTVGIYSLPPSYKAEATILPPQQVQSSLSSLISATGGLAASGMASQLGLKNPADLYIGILKSRTIADDIVNRFQLQKIYHAKLHSGARAILGSHATFASGKDTLIKISVKDRDARRSADLANAFVNELYKQNSRLAITDASQRRLFFDQQLSHEKDALADAEIALKATQQSTGLLMPGGQVEVLIRSGAQIRAEIASREVEIEAMRSYATESNPQLQTVKKEIAALEVQLGQIESSGASGSSFELSANRLPEASLQYIRKMRDLKYHETLFELLAKQYEASKIDEAKQAPVIQVVDWAVVPDQDSRPRLPLASIVAIAAFLGSGLLVLITRRVRELFTRASVARNLSAEMHAVDFAG